MCSVMALHGEPAQARDTVILITSGARKCRLETPPPTTRYSGKYLGSTAHSILIILILNLLETGQHPRKILSCKFIHLKLRTLMKKSDCTSRITSWIQKIHSPRTLVITFGTSLTERRAEEKEEYGYIPFGVKTHRSQFG